MTYKRYLILPVEGKKIKKNQPVKVYSPNKIWTFKNNNEKERFFVGEYKNLRIAKEKIDATITI